MAGMSQTAQGAAETIAGSLRLHSRLSKPSSWEVLHECLRFSRLSPCVAPHASCGWGMVPILTSSLPPSISPEPNDILERHAHLSSALPQSERPPGTFLEEPGRAEPLLHSGVRADEKIHSCKHATSANKIRHGNRATK